MILIYTINSINFLGLILKINVLIYAKYLEQCLLLHGKYCISTAYDYNDVDDLT